MLATGLVAVEAFRPRIIVLNMVSNIRGGVKKVEKFVSHLREINLDGSLQMAVTLVLPFFGQR